MNFSLTQEHKLLRKNAREFADNELLPGVLERDENKIWPKEEIIKMANMGFLGMMVNEKWGGSGMDPVSYALAIEQIARVDASAAVVMSVNNSLVCSLIEKYGNDFQKFDCQRPTFSEKLIFLD